MTSGVVVWLVVVAIRVHSGTLRLGIVAIPCAVWCMAMDTSATGNLVVRVVTWRSNGATGVASLVARTEVVLRCSKTTSSGGASSSQLGVAGVVLWLALPELALAIA